MLELIGFWAAVTMLVVPVLIVAWLPIEGFINREVRICTDKEHSFRPLGKRWDDYYRECYRNDTEFGVIKGLMLYAVITAGIYMVALGIAYPESGERIPFLQAFAQVCTDLVPVTQYIGVAAIFVFIQRKFVRPIIKRVYGVSKKLEKM